MCGQWRGKLVQGVVFYEHGWELMCLPKSLFNAVLPTLFLCSGGPMQSAQRASSRAVATSCAGKLLL